MATKIEEIEAEVRKMSPKEQKKLFFRLWKLVKIPPEDLGLLKLAESSFDFWDNPEDAIYDHL